MIPQLSKFLQRTGTFTRTPGILLGDFLSTIRSS